MMPVLLIVITGIVGIGCAGGPPKSFHRGSAGDTAVLLRQGLDFDRAFREVAFILNRHGFESEMLQPEVGYIRTRWNHSWTTSGNTLEAYRVRIICNFNPSRTQLLFKAEAEYMQNNRWVQGFDTRAIETLRNDLNMSIGN
jgi:hypothetical protein